MQQDQLKTYNVTFTFSITVEAKDENDAKEKAIDEYASSSTYCGYENIEDVMELINA